MKNRNNNLDKSKVKIKSAQWKSKERREEESKHKFYTSSATTRAYIQSSSNLLRFPFLVKILYKQRATKDVPSLVLFEQPSRCTLYLKRTTKDVPSLVLTITTKKLPASYTEFSND